MKTLITVLITIIVSSCMGQELKKGAYYKMYVHESNLDKIRNELSFNEDCLTWDKQETPNYLSNIEKRIMATPPAWASGMDFTEYILDTERGRYSYDIASGIFFKLHKKATQREILHENIDVKGILYAEKTLLIWVEKGEIKSSFEGIKSDNRNDLFIIWKVDFIITNGRIHATDIIDYRGCTLPRSF